MKDFDKKEIYSDFIHNNFGFWTLSCSETHVLGLSYSHSEPRFEHPTNSLVKECQKQLNAYFQCSLKQFDLPLMLDDYPQFYKAVWKQLVDIPYGETRTYSDIAASLSNPKSVRAVGRANAKNPIPIIIPCHRVLGKSTGMHGYVYGLELKRKLLEHEKLEGLNLSLF